MIWATGLFAFTIHSLSLKPNAPAAKTESIIVLTGGGARIETGLKLWSDGMSEQLFITGVHPNVDLEKITSLWKGPKPLPECCLTLGHKAFTTFQNALEAREWIENSDVKSIRLVTSEYHMVRSALEFKNALPGVQIIEHPVKQIDFELWTKRFWKVYLSEYHKVILRFSQQFFEPPIPLETQSKSHGE